MKEREREQFPGFNRNYAVIDAKALVEWLTGKLADLPEDVRETATYDSFLGSLSWEAK